MNRFDLSMQKRSLPSRLFLRMLLIIGLASCVVTFWGAFSVAADKSVSEEILEILKNKGDISEQKYEEMKKQAEEEKKASDWEFYWSNGFNLKSKDEKFEFKFGGRIMIDGAYIDADQEIDDTFMAAGDPQETGWGTEIRRARLYFEGIVYEGIFFKAQYDFAGGDPQFKDIYIGIQNIPVIGKIWVGNFQEPISLEELTSSKYITFMERALPNTFTPGRNVGIALANNALDKRLYWEIGGFQQANDFSDWNLSLRVAGRPWLAAKDKFLHLGLGYSHGFRNETEADASVRYRTRPEAHLSPNRLVDTGSILADGVDLLVPEVAFVYGPFSFQGEYFYNKVNSDVANDPTFTGWYAYVSYFLTGESRSYSGSTFSRIKPHHDFSIKDKGMGAIELALRYSTIDLTDEAITGGKENDWTLGFNWYLVPNSRVMFNYVRANVKDRDEGGVVIPDNDVNIFEARFQIDF